MVGLGGGGGWRVEGCIKWRLSGTRPPGPWDLFLSALHSVCTSARLKCRKLCERWGGRRGNSGCHGDGAEVLQGPLWLAEKEQHTYYIARRRTTKRRRAQWAPQGSWFSTVCAALQSWLFTAGLKAERAAQILVLHRCVFQSVSGFMLIITADENGWESHEHHSYSWATHEFNINEASLTLKLNQWMKPADLSFLPPTFLLLWWGFYT